MWSRASDFDKSYQIHMCRIEEKKVQSFFFCNMQKHKGFIDLWAASSNNLVDQ